MNKAIEQRVKSKLKEISSESQIPFNNLLDMLFLERFLVRISKSSYSEKLIFKGGMCLAQVITLGRETKDIDFLLKEVKGGLDKIQEILKEISSIEVNDGFNFSNIEVRELSIEHKKYPGYRIDVQGELSQIKNKVSIDVGIGDVVRPHVLTVELMSSGSTPLFEESIKLNSYPPEYIFSEKYEAIIYLGEVNGRMKDFYDCYRLITEDKLDKSLTNEAITETLQNRETEFSLISNPVEQIKIRWKSFVKKSKFDHLEIETVVATINSFVKNL